MIHSRSSPQGRVHKSLRRTSTMEFFLDTADVDEIREIAAWGILDGYDQPVAHQEVGPGLQEVVREIAGICSGPISAEVTAMDTAGMVDQGRALGRTSGERDHQNSVHARRAGCNEDSH